MNMIPNEKIKKITKDYVGNIKDGDRDFRF
jgi:hypothetical protein